MSTERPINILLYGLGAIGSFYAFILHRNPGVHLSVVARSNHAAVSTNGLLIRSEAHGEHRFYPKHTFRYAREAVGVVDRWDYVVVASKATDLEATVRELEGVVDGDRDGTVVVVMQNGVGNEDVFVARWEDLVVLSGVVWVGATQDEPGVVRQHISESTTIGTFEGGRASRERRREALDGFTALLRGGGTPVIVDECVQTPKWKKCIWNAAWNSITTLTAMDCHAWLKSSDAAMRTTKRMMAEAAEVAKMCGIPGIDETLPDELVKKMVELPGPVWTSMYHDSRYGRAMEVEVILGTIVRKGREKNVDVPTLETLYALVLAIDRRIEAAKA